MKKIENKNLVDLKTYWKSFEEKLDEPDEKRHLTGWQIFDKTNGLKNDGLYFIASRPGVGKTTFALNLAYSILKENLKTSKDAEYENVVLFFSLENSAKSLNEKFASLALKIKNEEFLKPKKEIWKNNSEKLKKLEKFNLIVIDKVDLNLEDINLTIQNLQKENKNIIAIFIDHIHILASNFAGTVFERTAFVSRALKKQAMIYQIPYFVLAQLSRDFEKSNSKKKTKIEPTNADLKDSGTIEQDADFILILEKGDTTVNDSNKIVSILNLHVTKNREGPLFKKFASFYQDFSFIKEINASSLKNAN